jgi:hypothetical protein
MNPTDAIVLLIASPLAIVLAFLYSRNRRNHLLHIERMAALEKGVPLPPMPAPQPWSPRVYLLRGLIWTFVGAAMVICLWGLASTIRHPVSAVDMAWEAKRLSESAGVSLSEAGNLVKKDAEQRSAGPPSTIALLGLIPLAVGLAYLVFYYTAENRDPAPPADLGRL